MKYIDISQTIFRGMKKYPPDPAVEVYRFKSLNKGGSCNLCKLVLGSHTGTHIDAPRHLFNKAESIDNVKVRDLICKVVVASIRELSQKRFFEKINRKSIKGILFKNERNRRWLTINEAKILVNNRIKLIGTESASIEEPSNKSHPVHRLLLSKGSVIIESLDLKKVKPGYYKLICLPLKIKNADGSPARAILEYD